LIGLTLKRACSIFRGQSSQCCVKTGIHCNEDRSTGNMWKFKNIGKEPCSGDKLLLVNRKIGMKTVDVAKKLRVTQPAVSKNVLKGTGFGQRQAIGIGEY